MYIGSTFIFNQVHWLNFHLQPVIHVETKLMKVDDQCVSMLIQGWCVPWFPATLDNCVLLLQHEIVWPPHQILLDGTNFLKLREILSVRHTTTDYFWLRQRTLLEFEACPEQILLELLLEQWQNILSAESNTVKDILGWGDFVNTCICHILRSNKEGDTTFFSEIYLCIYIIYI